MGFGLYPDIPNEHSDKLRTECRPRPSIEGGWL